MGAARSPGTVSDGRSVGGIAGAIMRLFSKAVEVDVHPDPFTITCGGRSLFLNTFVDVSINTETGRLLFLIISDL